MSTALFNQRIDTLNRIMGTSGSAKDVINESEGCVEEPLPDLNSFDSEYDFNEFCDKLRKYYQSYIRYHLEQERNSL